MNKKALIAGAVAAALIAVLVAFLRKSDRRQIETLIGRLERRLERRDAVGFCLYLTDDYHDSAGQSRPGLKDRLAWGLPLLASLAISVEDLGIEIREKEATADFLARAVATARDHGRQPPWRWESRVRLTLRKTDDGWRVCKAEYRLPPIVERNW